MTTHPPPRQVNPPPAPSPGLAPRKGRPITIILDNGTEYKGDGYPPLRQVKSTIRLSIASSLARHSRSTIPAPRGVMS